MTAVFIRWVYLAPSRQAFPLFKQVLVSGYSIVPGVGRVVTFRVSPTIPGGCSFGRMPVNTVLDAALDEREDDRHVGCGSAAGTCVVVIVNADD